MHWSTKNCRSRGSIAKERGKLTGKPNFSVKALPIPLLPVGWNTPLIQVVPPDTLHMQNRGGDKLMRGFITASGNLTKEPLAPKLVELIRSTGVRFKTFHHTVHNQQQVGYTSLTGRSWRILLKNLGPAIMQSNGVFPDKDKEHFAELVAEFHRIIEFAGKCEKSDADQLAQDTNNWVKMFLSLGEKGYKGFGKDDVTPYIHWLHVHVPYSTFLWGGLDKFNGELLEKQNDHIKLTHQRRTHCKDDKMTLLAEKRRELQLMKAEIERHNTKKTRIRREGPLHPW